MSKLIQIQRSVAWITSWSGWVWSKQDKTKSDVSYVDNDDGASVIDEDEIFEDDTNGIDPSDKMYKGGSWWQPKNDGSIDVRYWDMFEGQCWVKI